MNITSIYFLPPLAIARVGGSDTPLDCFVWDSDRTVYGAHRTIIKPELSLDVLADGSLRPYLPNSIQFKDRGQLRPVAPFFELWVRIDVGTDDGVRLPLTPTLLAQFDASTDNIEYTVTVANRKAQRRTNSASCAYIARESINASDFAPRPLKAFSPHGSGEEPLVYKDHPDSPWHIPGHQAGVTPCHGHRSRRAARALHTRKRQSLRPARRHLRAGVAAAAGSCTACGDTGRTPARNRSAGKPHPQSEHAVVQTRHGPGQDRSAAVRQL